ncbi:putative ribonuclease H-like domain-containing protein [Tanacetum coccineum]
MMLMMQLKLSKKEFAQETKDLLLQAGAAKSSSTNIVNTVSTPVSTVSPYGGLSFTESNPITGQRLTLEIPALEEIYDNPTDGIFTHSSYDDEGAVADFTNLEHVVNVSPIPTSRIKSIHPATLILRDPQSAVQTRSKVTKSYGAHAFIQKVWILVDLPYGKKAIGTKWVYRNKKDNRGVMVRNKARLVAQGYKQEQGIDYDEVFAPMARIEAIRIFLAFTSYMGFIVYQMDMKSAFPYGKIDEETAFSTQLWTQKALVRDEEASDVELLYIVNPKTSHLSTVKKIFRYLKGKPKLGLWYPRVSLFDLEAYSDSDYAGANLDRTIAQQNPVFHSKTKHTAIRHHFIRDAYEKKLIQVLKIHTNDNVADLLTKAFDVSRGFWWVIKGGQYPVIRSLSGNEGGMNTQASLNGDEKDQTVLGKDYSNILIADSLLKTIWFINAPCYGIEALASPKANAICCDAEEMRCKFKIESERLVDRDGLIGRVTQKMNRELCFHCLNSSRPQTQREQLGDASIEIHAYTQALKKVEAQLVAHQQSQLWYEENIRFMKIDLDDKTDVLTYHKKLLAEAKKVKEDLKAKSKNTQPSWKKSGKPAKSQISANDKFGLVYWSYQILRHPEMHACSTPTPPPMTGNYMPSGPDIEIDYSQFTYGPKQSQTSESKTQTSDFDTCESDCSVETHESLPEQTVNEPKVVSQPKVWSDAPIIEEYESDSADSNVSHNQQKKRTPRIAKKASEKLLGKLQALPTNAAKKVNTVKPIVNNAIPKSDFHKSVLPFRKSLNRTTTLRTNFSYQKVNTAKVNAVSAVRGKRETAVKLVIC